MQRYRNGDEKLSHVEWHLDKLDFMVREDAVVDGVMVHGLVDNRQPKLALKYVLQVLKAREEERVSDFRLAGFVCMHYWYLIVLFWYFLSLVQMRSSLRGLALFTCTYPVKLCCATLCVPAWVPCGSLFVFL